MLARCDLPPTTLHLAFRVAIALAIAAPAAFPAVAGAATTIGQTGDSSESCISGTGTFVWLTSGSGKPLYTVPAAGVITSWTTNPGTHTGTATRLEVLRPGTLSTNVVGESAVESDLPAHNTAPFPTNIPVEAGDLIALENVNASAFSCRIPAPGDEFSAVPDNGPGQPVGPVDSTFGNFRINVAATVTGPPTSSFAPGCSQSAFTGIVNADSGATPKAFHYKVDGGPEQTYGAGSASILLPQGHHSVEHWGEDQFGQQEAPRHTTSVTADNASPSVSISSDQSRSAYNASEPATVTTVASDALSALTTDPSRAGEPISTAHAGEYAVTKSATDACGNTGTATFAYTVAPVDTPPVFSPTAFPAATRGASMARKRRTGSSISYQSSDAGTTSFLVYRAVTGRRRGGKCVAPSRAPSGKRCTRYVRVQGGFVHRDVEGMNRFRFSGRVSRRALRPGRYRLNATPTATGRTGPTTSTGFRIIR
jgi:hypothetical protein